jgi:hypothetical protein
VGSQPIDERRVVLLARSKIPMREDLDRNAGRARAIEPGSSDHVRDHDPHASVELSVANRVQDGL